LTELLGQLTHEEKGAGLFAVGREEGEGENEPKWLSIFYFFFPSSNMHELK
jgi:hypothetical protein